MPIRQPKKKKMRGKQNRYLPKGDLKKFYRFFGRLGDSHELTRDPGYYLPASPKGGTMTGR